MRTKVIIGLGVALVAVGIAAVVLWSSSGDDRTSRPTESVLIRPTPWPDIEATRVGLVDPVHASIQVLDQSVKAPVPVGYEMTWQHASSGWSEILTASSEIGGEGAKFTWVAAQGNPHTVFDGLVVAPRSKLTEPLTSIIELPDGEVTYLSEGLARVPFAGAPIELSALTHGPIIWRNGEDTIALWQWHADRVTLAATDDGGLQVQFHWWDPAMHPLPEACAGALNDTEVEIAPRVTISFGEVPAFGFGRLPNGVTSAVIPVFVDPQEIEDARFRDGASGSEEDFVNRARTIAFGHSSTNDARYGNGGLAGLDVGGTIVVPRSYDVSSEPFKELTEASSAAKIELIPEDDLRPADCKALASRMEGRAPLLASSRPFDGKFPNLFAPDQRGAIPGLNGQAPMWRPTALTGRRKDVVTQALSSTYLTRLADARGIAMLEIPIIATRNPLVAVAAEALLEPERDGQWTIEESVARALGEVELLSEDDRFDFVGLSRFVAHTDAMQHVEIGQRTPDTWLVFANGAAVEGFTMIFEHEVAVTVDGQPVETALRTLGNGSRQTWAWWDLSEGAPYELQIEGDVAPSAVRWSLPE